MANHEYFMREALEEASKAYKKGEVPVGAVVVRDNQIIGRGHNQRETLQLSRGHAEMMAIEEASLTIGSWRLEQCSLYVTLEPCPMCAGASVQSRIDYVYYGTKDDKNGVDSSGINVFEGNYTHTPHLQGGVLEDEARTLMKSFFKTLRNQ